MTTKRVFTSSAIEALRLPGKQPGTTAGKPYKLAEWAPKGEGRLLVRVQPTGAKEFFYRLQVNDRDTLLALGRFDPNGKSGKTLKQIRAELDSMRRDQRLTGDVKAHRKEQERKQEVEKRKGSFAQLLEAYVEALRADKKSSAEQVAGIFRAHVIEAFPRLALTKANAITRPDISGILARMVQRGLTRQVNKTRSYLRAAFAFGMHADTNPERTAAAGVLFGLTINPVDGIKPIRKFEKTLERALSEIELRAYWSSLEDLPIAQRATLRLNLALAAQRPTQLLRADWQAFDFHENTLLIKDSKGRGGSRDHLLPMTPFALEQLAPLRQLNDKAKAGTPFTADGEKPLTVEQLSECVSGISAKLKADGIAPFDQRAIRRTVETMLQKLGIDREVRAHLLSHGRSQGVQGRHYERYDYLPEKRQALERWNAHLVRIILGKSDSKVVTLKSA